MNIALRIPKSVGQLLNSVCIHPLSHIDAKIMFIMFKQLQTAEFWSTVSKRGLHFQSLRMPKCLS